MTGILYLILGSLCGKELAEIFVGQKKTGKNNRIWLVLPACFWLGNVSHCLGCQRRRSRQTADIRKPADNGCRSCFSFGHLYSEIQEKQKDFYR